MRQLGQRWLPPRTWTEDDGLSGVPDFHYGPAGRNHDWRYRTWGVLPGLTAPQTRRLVDIAFRYDMANRDRLLKPWLTRFTVWLVVRWAYYFGVRLFGSRAFKPYPKLGVK